jgi:chromosome segregation ATPase
LVKNRVILGEILPEEPEKFDKAENKYKLTLVQMDKRFVDLETAITELREKAKEVIAPSISPLQQKVDDLEDLIMVEQAGILELKKMLEEAKGKLEQAPDLSSVISKSNEKLNSLEKEISALRQNVVPKAEFEDKIRKMQTDVASVSVKSPPTSLEMENLHKNFEDLNDQLKSFSSRTENNLKGLYDKIKEIESKETFAKPGIDFDFLSSKIESLKLSLDSMTKKKIEMDLKIAEMEKKFDIIENNIREAVTENVTDEIKNNRKDLMTTNIRIDSLERVSRELLGSIQNLENSMKKFESLERVTLLSKDIENKIEKFKFIEEEMKRLSSKVELMYGDIERRLTIMGNLERNVSKLNERFSSLTKEFDKSRIDIANKVGNDLIKGLEKKLEERMNEMRNELEKNRMDVASRVSIDSIRGLEKKLEGKSNEMRNMLGEFNNKIQFTDNMLAKINERINVVDNNYRNATQNVKKVEAKQSPQELKQVMEILKNHESRLSETYNQINNTQNRISNLQNTVQQKVAEMKITSDADEQVNELLNKIIFLESRLGAIESLMIKSQEVSKAQPVILE